MREDAQQATPIYDLLAKALQKWDILRLTKFETLAYEDTVVWLLHHLPEAHDFHSVERLVLQAFAEQQVYPDFSPEQWLLIKFLSDDIANCWADYLQRSEKPTFSQVRFRSRMRQHYLPMTTSRSTARELTLSPCP